jgi:hypothetical protein
MAKVTFDIITRTIQILGPPVIENGEPVIDIDVKIDLYSDGKEAWVASNNLRRLDFPIRAVGGDPLPGNRQLGSTFFLRPDWKIKPYEGSHRLRINGNFYSEDGTTPFLNTEGNFNIFLEQSLSSLVDSTIAQLTQIESATYLGVIHLDQLNGYTLETVPSDVLFGTENYPANNWEDAVAEATKRNINTFSVKGTFVFTNSDLSGYNIFGSNPLTSVAVLSGTGNSTINTVFKHLILTGTIAGPVYVESCGLQTLDGVGSTLFPTVFRDCIFRADVGSDPMCQFKAGAGIQNIHFVDCVSGVPGAGTSTIDANNSDAPFAFRRFGGGIAVNNVTQGQEITIEIDQGQCKFLSGNTLGTVQVRGGGKISLDESGPDFIVVSEANTISLLNEILTQGGSLTPEQNQLLIDIHKALALNDQHPVIHTQSGFTVDDINVNITGDKDLRIATRQ